MAKINWCEYIPDFKTPIKLAHKSNGFAHYHDDKGNNLTIPLADVTEFERKLRAKQGAQGIALPIVMMLLLFGALIVFGLSCGG